MKKLDELAHKYLNNSLSAFIVMVLAIVTCFGSAYIGMVCKIIVSALWTVFCLLLIAVIIYRKYLARKERKENK